MAALNINGHDVFLALQILAQYFYYLYYTLDTLDGSTKHYWTWRLPLWGWKFWNFETTKDFYKLAEIEFYDSKRSTNYHNSIKP